MDEWMYGCITGWMVRQRDKRKDGWVVS